MLPNNYKTMLTYKQDIDGHRKKLATDDDVEYAAVIRRVKTFYDPVRKWRFHDRPDQQTPFAFAEAGLECLDSDEVACRVCDHTFSDWKAEDVPMTVHKSVESCKFMDDMMRKKVKYHPSVQYAVKNTPYSLNVILNTVSDNPKLLDAPVQDLLCALMKNTYKVDASTFCRPIEIKRI